MALRRGTASGNNTERGSNPHRATIKLRARSLKQCCFFTYSNLTKMELSESKCIPYGIRVVFTTPDGWEAFEDFSPDGKYGRVGIFELDFNKFVEIKTEAEAEAEAERLYGVNYSMSGFHWVYYPKGTRIYRSRKGQTPWGETNTLHDEEFVTDKRLISKTLSISEIKTLYPDVYREMKSLEEDNKGIYFIEK